MGGGIKKKKKKKKQLDLLRNANAIDLGGEQSERGE
jgi:hypothetical protein